MFAPPPAHPPRPSDVDMWIGERAPVAGESSRWSRRRLRAGRKASRGPASGPSERVVSARQRGVLPGGAGKCRRADPVVADRVPGADPGAVPVVGARGSGEHRHSLPRPGAWWSAGSTATSGTRCTWRCWPRCSGRGCRSASSACSRCGRFPPAASGGAKRQCSCGDSAPSTRSTDGRCPPGCRACARDTRARERPHNGKLPRHCGINFDCGRIRAWLFAR